MPPPTPGRKSRIRMFTFHTLSLNPSFSGPLPFCYLCLILGDFMLSLCLKRLTKKGLQTGEEPALFLGPRLGWGPWLAEGPVLRACGFMAR